MREVVVDAPEADACQPFPRRRIGRLLALAAHTKRGARIFQHRPVRQQRKLLKHHRHPGLSQSAELLGGSDMTSTPST